ncbi:MAG TPA: ABC transporter permease [Gemmatimonadaceae bacterium]
MGLEVFRIALAALRANVLRSILTMLGIVIGVAAVIAMIALGDGAQQSVRERIGKLGTTVLQIDAARIVQGGIGTNVTKRMTMDDVRAIEERSPHILAVQPQQDKDYQIVWRNKNTNITILGVSSNYLAVRKYDIAQGRMFTSGEDIGKQRVVVLGAGALTQLDADPNAIIGDFVRINGMQFQVIGTLKAKGATGFGSPDDNVIIPFGTARWRLFKTDRIDDIFALAASEDDIPMAMGEISLALRRSHRIKLGAQDDFRIRNQADILSTLSETTAVFSTLLAGIAAVSLLVGGIGIMNIMLVSVTERTREIGIRKALGASRRTILFQFLIEAITLCLLGGAIGVAAGVGGAIVLRDAFGWTTAIGPTSIALAFAFATLVGLLFGVWPARRASSLDPIEALRFE